MNRSPNQQVSQMKIIRHACLVAKNKFLSGPYEHPFQNIRKVNKTSSVSKIVRNVFLNLASKIFTQIKHKVEVQK